MKHTYTATPVPSHEGEVGVRYRIDWPSGTMERTFNDDKHMARWLSCMNDSAACDRMASASYQPAPE